MDALLAALGGEGLWLLTLGALVAGLVRGFSGFGAALVFLPVAGQVVPPFEALTMLILMDLTGPLPNLPRAWREGSMTDILRLSAGSLVALPLGVWVLSLIPAEVFRYAMSGVALSMVVVLALGLRYRGALSRGAVLATGAISGFMAGSVGLPGPPVILFYMASSHPVRVIRANLLLFFVVSDVTLLAVLALGGYLVLSAAITGVLLIVPYLLANMAGAAIFNPERSGTYRTLAYVIVTVSAILGLPLFD